MSEDVKIQVIEGPITNPCPVLGDGLMKCIETVSPLYLEMEDDPTLEGFLCFAAIFYFSGMANAGYMRPIVTTDDLSGLSGIIGGLVYGSGVAALDGMLFERLGETKESINDWRKCLPQEILNIREGNDDAVEHDEH